MRKLIYIYLGIIFGGAIIAILVLRYQERGATGLLALVGLFVAYYAIARRQQKKRRAEEVQ